MRCDVDDADAIASYRGGASFSEMILVMSIASSGTSAIGLSQGLGGTGVRDLERVVEESSVVDMDGSDVRGMLDSSSSAR